MKKRNLLSKIKEILKKLNIRYKEIKYSGIIPEIDYIRAYIGDNMIAISSSPDNEAIFICSCICEIDKGIIGIYELLKIINEYNSKIPLGKLFVEAAETITVNIEYSLVLGDNEITENQFALLLDKLVAEIEDIFETLKSRLEFNKTGNNLPA